MVQLFTTRTPPVLIPFLLFSAISGTSSSISSSSIYPTQPYALLDSCLTGSNITKNNNFNDDQTPIVHSVFPASISNATVVLKISIKDAVTVLQSNDLSISWTWAAGRARSVAFSKRSQRLRIISPIQDDEFHVELELEKDTTGACNSDINASTWDGFCPLWKRQTYFHAQLVKKQSSRECQFTSKDSASHGRILLPCPAGTFMRVLVDDTWFDRNQAGLNQVNYFGINASLFMDFAYRPDDHLAKDMTACMPCNNKGLDCAKGSAGFHGGVQIRPGHWRVDFATSAKFAAARCRTPGVCDTGGRCSLQTKRTGPLCELCISGFALKGGKCVSCDEQDYTALGIAAGILVILIAVVAVFRKKIVALRFLWRDLIRIFKVLLDTSQILAAMPVVLDGIVWPDAILTMLRYCNLASLDITQYIGINCVGGQQVSYFFRATFLLSFVFLALVVLLALHVALINRKSNWWMTKATEEQKKEFAEQVLNDLFDDADADDSMTLDQAEVDHIITKLSSSEVAKKLVVQHQAEGSKDMEKNEFVNFMLRSQDKKLVDLGPIILNSFKTHKQREIMTILTPFILILHTPVTAKVFALFSCDRVGGPGRMLRSTSLSDRETFGFLKADYSAGCLDLESPPEQVVFYVFAFLFLAFVTIGFPCALALYMWRRRKILYSFEVWSTIGFIYERFNRGAEFCDLHILMYKTLLCAGIVTLQDWPVLQRAVGTAISVCYLTWYAYLSPMRNNTVTLICLYGIGTSCFFYVSAGIFAAGSDTDPFIQMMVAYLMIAAAGGLLLAGMLAVVYSIKLARASLSDPMAHHRTSTRDEVKRKNSLTQVAPMMNPKRMSGKAMEAELSRIQREHVELREELSKMKETHRPETTTTGGETSQASYQETL